MAGMLRVSNGGELTYSISIQWKVSELAEELRVLMC